MATKTTKTRAFASVLRFTEKVTKEKAEQIIADLKKKGLIDEYVQVYEYNPEYGGPVFYVP